MLEPVPLWKQTFRSIPMVDNVSWSVNIARWASERSTAKLQWIVLGGPIQFIFNTGVFQSQLSSMRFTADPNQGAMAFASAWESAMNASQLIVVPGVFVGAPSPATLFSVVIGAIDPGSILLGKMALYQQLVSAPFVNNSFDSILPPALNQAFLSLTVSLSGMNSLPIPTPLVAPMVPAF